MVKLAMPKSTSWSRHIMWSIIIIIVHVSHFCVLLLCILLYRYWVLIAVIIGRVRCTTAPGCKTSSQWYNGHCAGSALLISRFELTTLTIVSPAITLSCVGIGVVLYKARATLEKQPCVTTTTFFKMNSACMLLSRFNHSCLFHNLVWGLKLSKRTKVS